MIIDCNIEKKYYFSVVIKKKQNKNLCDNNKILTTATSNVDIYDHRHLQLVFDEQKAFLKNNP